jgi:hypothetical protein
MKRTHEHEHEPMSRNEYIWNVLMIGTQYF